MLGHTEQEGIWPGSLESKNFLGHWEGRGFEETVLGKKENISGRESGREKDL